MYPGMCTVVPSRFDSFSFHFDIPSKVVLRFMFIVIAIEMEQEQRNNSNNKKRPQIIFFHMKISKNKKKQLMSI